MFMAQCGLSSCVLILQRCVLNHSTQPHISMDLQRTWMPQITWRWELRRSHIWLQPKRNAGKFVFSPSIFKTSKYGAGVPPRRPRRAWSNKHHSPVLYFAKIFSRITVGEFLLILCMAQIHKYIYIYICIHIYMYVSGALYVAIFR